MNQRHKWERIQWTGIYAVVFTLAFCIVGWLIANFVKTLTPHQWSELKKWVFIGGMMVSALSLWVSFCTAMGRREPTAKRPKVEKIKLAKAKVVKQ